jgi:DNA repair protein RadC
MNDELSGGEKPIDRLYRAGVESLSDAELVSVLIDRGVSEAGTLVCDGLPAFARTSWTSASPPVTRRQAGRVMASLELGRRLAETIDERQPITDWAILGRQLMARHAYQTQERLGAVYLDSRNRIIREREIYVGTLNFATVSTRDVLRFALEDHAASLIVYHNHPSGDPEPSADDLLFTRKLVEAGKLLAVDILDHLILGIGRFVSLKQRGAM